MDAELGWVLIAELALVLVLAIVSASDVAIHAVRRPHILEELGEQATRAHRAEEIAQRADHYVAALHVMGALTQFAFAAIAAAFVAPLLPAALGDLGVKAYLSDVVAVVVTVIVLTVIALLFGLFVPRAIGARYPVGVLVALARPIEVMGWITRPLVAVLWLLTRLLTSPLGARPHLAAVSEDEIRALVETGEEQGVLREQERDMIQGIFDLSDKQVHDVMIPRTDIRAIDVETPGEKVLEQVVAVGHSRIPVYQGTPDEIVGTLYVKDLFRRLARGEKDVSLRQYLRPAHFVPETKRVDQLLTEMQKNKVHMAIVVDEYGGTAGLVTIEDLVEEIVGEIRDEYESEPELVIPVSEHEALMDGRIPFDDVIEAFDLDLPPSEDYDTLGGYIVHELGRLPRQGEEVRTDGVRFAVETVDGRRVRRVRVTRAAPEAEEAAVER
jgi:magnesium and cobalt exporter, CNNM family